MKVKLITTMLFLTFSVSPSLSIEIRGIVQCGDWVKARTTNSDLRIAFYNSFVGYISGMAVGSNEDILSGTNNESLYLWMDNYCKNNPLSTIQEGVRHKLYFELLNKVKK